MESSSKAELVVTQPGFCNSLGECVLAEVSTDVQVDWIEQKDGVGWRLGGKGKITAACPACGNMLTAVRTRIPLECAAYECPTCHKYEELTYKVNRIDAEGENFSFEAEISCGTCQRKRSFAKTLKDLLTIKKIEIKLTGISIER